LRDGYAWITANIMYQAPWHPANFDREALKKDLNEIPEIAVNEIEVINRNWLSYFKEADVWFEVTDNTLSETEVRDKMLTAVKTGNRARESIRRLKLAPHGEIPDGEVPSGMYDSDGLPWQPIIITALAVGFLFALIDVASGN